MQLSKFSIKDLPNFIPLYTGENNTLLLSLEKKVFFQAVLPSLTNWWIYSDDISQPLESGSSAVAYGDRAVEVQIDLSSETLDKGSVYDIRFQVVFTDGSTIIKDVKAKIN